MEKNRKALNFFVDEVLFKKINDFRFENRFESRVAAIKFLLEKALEQNFKP